MSFNGVRLFRRAVVFESVANLGSLIPLFLFPEATLSYFVKGPSQITPATKSLAQWLGATILALTVPLLLSYPNPRPSQGGNGEIAAFRKLSYMTLSAGEAGLATLFVIQYVNGNSGMTDTALFAAMGFLGAFLGMHVFFLVVKPGWMAAQENAKKAL